MHIASFQILNLPLPPFLSTEQVKYILSELEDAAIEKQVTLGCRVPPYV